MALSMKVSFQCSNAVFTGINVGSLLRFNSASNS